MDDREDRRIAFLIERDGREAAEKWVRRTLRIYRAAVLDRNHFAAGSDYRRKFIASYCAFKRWLYGSNVG